MTTAPINTHMQLVQNVVCPADGSPGRGDWCENWGFKSYHPGGVNFALCDVTLE